MPKSFETISFIHVPHQVGWLITAIFAMIACVASGWLINKHLQWYTNVSLTLSNFIMDLQCVCVRVLEKGTEM